MSIDPRILKIKDSVIRVPDELFHIPGSSKSWATQKSPVIWSRASKIVKSSSGRKLGWLYQKSKKKKNIYSRTHSWKLIRFYLKMLPQSLPNRILCKFSQIGLRSVWECENKNVVLNRSWDLKQDRFYALGIIRKQALYITGSDISKFP